MVRHSTLADGKAGVCAFPPESEASRATSSALFRRTEPCSVPHTSHGSSDRVSSGLSGHRTRAFSTEITAGCRDPTWISLPRTIRLFGAIVQSTTLGTEGRIHAVGTIGIIVITRTDGATPIADCASGRLTHGNLVPILPIATVESFETIITMTMVMLRILNIPVLAIESIVPSVLDNRNIPTTCK